MPHILLIEPKLFWTWNKNFKWNLLNCHWSKYSDTAKLKMSIFKGHFHTVGQATLIRSLFLGKFSWGDEREREKLFLILSWHEMSVLSLSSYFFFTYLSKDSVHTDTVENRLRIISDLGAYRMTALFFGIYWVIVLSCRAKKLSLRIAV